MRHRDIATPALKKSIRTRYQGPRPTGPQRMSLCPRAVGPRPPKKPGPMGPGPWAHGPMGPWAHGPKIWKMENHKIDFRLRKKSTELPEHADRSVSSRRYDSSVFRPWENSRLTRKCRKMSKRSTNHQKSNSTPHWYQQMLGVLYFQPPSKAVEAVRANNPT